MDNLTRKVDYLQRKVDAMELPLAEANLAIIEVRKTLLQQQAGTATILGDTARVSYFNVEEEPVERN